MEFKNAKLRISNIRSTPGCICTYIPRPSKYHLETVKIARLWRKMFFWWVQYLDDPPHLVMIPNMIHLFLANYWTILYHIIIP